MMIVYIKLNSFDAPILTIGKYNQSYMITQNDTKQNCCCCNASL